MKTLDPQLVWTTEHQLADDPIAHGTAAEAWILALIDAGQVALLWGSVPHWSAVVDIPTTSGTAVEIPLAVPPLVNRARALFLASGVGNVYIESLTIAVDTANEDQAGATADGIGHFGVFASDTLIDVSPGNGDPALQNLTVYSDPAVKVWAMAFRWARDDQDLTDAV